MKKIIYLMVFVLTTTVLTLSCSSDSGGSSTGGDKIVGNWKNTGLMFEGTFIPTENEPCEDLFYKFNSNGTGKVTEEICDEPSEISDFSWENVGNSNYYVSGIEGQGALSVTFSDGNKKMTVYNGEATEYGVVFQKQ